MKCINPIRIKNKGFPETSDLEFIDVACGKCYNCLVNRRNNWLFRLTEESLLHQHTYFVTLTYSDDNLPLNGWLKKSDLQKFFKRLRKNLDYLSGEFSYYAIGEYGTNTYRPHYHFIAFCDYPDLDIFRTFVNKSWNKGLISVFNSTTASINYVLHYHVRPKNPLINTSDGVFPAPAFAVMSKGLGVGFLYDEDNGLRKYKHWLINLVTSSDNRVVTNRYGRSFILPRYYTKKIEELGYTLFNRKFNQINTMYENIKVMFPDLEINSQSLPVNMSKEKYASLMHDLIKDSEKKLKKYNYQNINSL